MSRQRPRPCRLHLAAQLLALSAAALCLPAQALYKVVGPDGKVTYTDRIPGPADGKVTPIAKSGNNSGGDASAQASNARAGASSGHPSATVSASSRGCGHSFMSMTSTHWRG